MHDDKKKKKGKPDLSPDIFVIMIFLISFAIRHTQMNKQSFSDTATACIVKLKPVNAGCMRTF